MVGAAVGVAGRGRAGRGRWIAPSSIEPLVAGGDWEWDKLGEVGVVGGAV